MPELTPLSLEQVADLVARAGLGRAVDATPLAGGFANTSYLVRRADAPRIVLTVVNDKPRDHALAVTRLQTRLADRGTVPVARPLATLDLAAGEIGAATSGRSPELVVLKEFVEGEVPPAFDVHHLERLGRMHHALHTLPAETSPPETSPPGRVPQLPRGLDYGPETWRVAAEWGGQHAAFVAWLMGWRTRVEATGVGLRRDDPPAAAAAAFPGAAFPSAIIHFDVDVDNTVWRGAELVAVLDWEEACITARIWDLASTLCWAHRGATSWRPDLAAALLRGYGASNLTPEERAALRPLTGAAAASHAFWHWRTNHFVRPGAVADPEHAARVRMALADATLGDA